VETTNNHKHEHLRSIGVIMQEEKVEVPQQKRRSVYDLSVGAEMLLSHGSLMEGEEEIEKWYALIDEWAEESGDKLCALRVIKKMALRRIEGLKTELELFKAAIAREERTLSAMDEKATVLLEGFFELTGKTKASTADGGWVGLRTFKGEKINIIDESLIPDGFVDIKRVPNKAALKEALMSELEIPGVELERSERKGVQWGKMK
jgi:hypothetical protein